MASQFKNMTDLVDYLNTLELRVKALEAERDQSRTASGLQGSVDGNAITRYVQRILPNTKIISSSFFKRAFAVWGHFFVANLLIGIVVSILYACLTMAMFGSLFGDLIQSQK